MLPQRILLLAGTGAIAAVLCIFAFRTVPQSTQAVQEVKPTMDPSTDKPTSMPALTPEEKRVIQDKGTERPFTGKYWNTFDEGTYVCRQCGTPLYTSKSKFVSECGWPSFDDEIPGAVKRTTDADGLRTEITCAHCGAHLGHVFLGEQLTPKNVRHCVNSTSLVLVPARKDAKKDAKEQAIFAGGCFWGVDHYFRQVPGVLNVESGYTGGTTPHPTYRQVCTGTTGHAEAVRVTYDPSRVTYEKLAKLFFEIHDPTTVNCQGPDAGTQYRSAVFYADPQQKQIAEKLIAQLRARGYEVVTQLQAASEFYPAEDYHQDYMDKHPNTYDCHVPVPRFEQDNHAKAR